MPGCMRSPSLSQLPTPGPDCMEPTSSQCSTDDTVEDEDEEERGRRQDEVEGDGS